MNRRSFIKSSAGAVAALLFAPEIERRVFALDQTMIPDIIIPGGRRDAMVYIHDGLFEGVIHDWSASTEGGIIIPGLVSSPNRNLRTYFYVDGNAIRAEISDKFPKGIGCPSGDRDAVGRLFSEVSGLRAENKNHSPSKPSPVFGWDW